MIEPVRTFDELAIAQVGILRRTLTGVGDAELDWRMHPEANPIRWLLGHHLWYETWVPDAIEATGRFLVDEKPTSLLVADVDDFWTRFDAAVARRRAVYGGLEPADLDRAFDYLGVAEYSVAQLVRTHAAHFTGHTWQVRYVRGTYSRAFGTDKRVFDPF
jgi:hypothetical protein